MRKILLHQEGKPCNWQQVWLGSRPQWPRKPWLSDNTIPVRLDLHCPWEDGASHCSLPFGLGRLAIPGLPCYGHGCSAAPSHTRRAERAQSLENFTPFFKVIVENQEKVLSCFWHSFERSLYFGRMAICKELTPRQVAVWGSDVLSLMEIKPCPRLSCQVKPFQKTNDQPADCYTWQYWRTFIQRFFGGLKSKPGSDKLHKSQHLANSSSWT